MQIPTPPQTQLTHAHRWRRRHPSHMHTQHLRAHDIDTVCTTNTLGTASAHTSSPQDPSHMHTQPAVPVPPSLTLPCCVLRPATPKTNEEIQHARKEGIPQRTQQDTKYCVQLWKEWRVHRQGSVGEARWLTYFVLEVQKKDGSEYSLHHICAGLLRHFRESGCIVDIFKDPEFASFS